MVASHTKTSEAKIARFDLAINATKHSSIDEKLYLLKTTPGRLRGEVRIAQSHHGLCYSIKANKPLFGCGQKREGSLSFGLIDSSEQLCHGPTLNFSNDLSGLSDKLISGFSSRTNFRSFHLPANNRLITYICDKQDIQAKIEKAGTNFRLLCSKVNTILPHYKCKQELEQIYKAILDGPKEDPIPSGLTAQLEGIVHNTIANCFALDHITDQIPIKLTHRHELCKDLIIWGHDHIDEELRLERVVEELHTTRASLSLKAVKKSWESDRWKCCGISALNTLNKP